MTEKDPLWKKIFQNRRLRIALAAFLVIGATAFGINWLVAGRAIVPEELLQASIPKTLAESSYRFHTKSTIELNGKTTVFSDLTGEKASDQQFHVEGNMLGTPVNVYQVDNTTYRMDALSKKWMVVENNSIWRESMLMAELNPLSNFQFQKLISSSYLGREKINKRQTYKIQCAPQIKSKWLDYYFKDLTYIIWVDKKDQMIRKAVITAKSKEKETGSLRVEVNFYDYGKKIDIQPPVAARSGNQN